jgi:hypothetical protein
MSSGRILSQNLHKWKVRVIFFPLSFKFCFSIPIVSDHPINQWGRSAERWWINLDDDVFGWRWVEIIPSRSCQIASEITRHERKNWPARKDPHHRSPASTLSFDENSSRRPTINCDFSTELYCTFTLSVLTNSIQTTSPRVQTFYLPNFKLIIT